LLYQRWGDNRSYKSAFNAYDGYLDYLRGKTVYCNCALAGCRCNGQEPWLCPKCILLYPHSHLSPLDPDFTTRELFNCTLITDQSESSGLDSRTSMSISTIEAGHFVVQAKKAGVDWRYDIIRHKRLDIELRKATDWYIHHIRIPALQKVWYDDDGTYHDWPPAQAVKLKVLHRDSTRPKTYTYYRPFLEKLHKLYRTEVVIHGQSRQQQTPNIPALHRQLVAP
jgi:hypothetical protein